MALGGTLKLEELDLFSTRKDFAQQTRNNSRGPSRRESTAEAPGPPAPPLEWTHQPIRVEQCEGNVRCRVSMPASPGERVHQPHLVQTLRIEPQLQAASAPAKPPPMPGRRVEQIVVKESDLRRCGHDLQKLRQCQMRPRSRDPEEPPQQKAELEMSFKSAFVQRCRDGHEVRDPWKGKENPEYGREQSEQDLVLNQVWLGALQKKHASIEASAAATDGFLEFGHAGGLEFMPGAVEDQPPPSSENIKSASYRGRSKGHAGRHMPARAASAEVPSQTKPAEQAARRRELSSQPASSSVKSRIQSLDSMGTTDISEVLGSGTVKAATRAQRFGLRQLPDQLHYDAEPRAAWFSVEPRTGNIRFYQRAAAERLEGAYRSGRVSVPMSGLGREVEDSVVRLGRPGEDQQPVEVALNGGERDVQRVLVPGSMTGVRVRVIWKSTAWRLVRDSVQADDGVPHLPSPSSSDHTTIIEERSASLSGAELVDPQKQQKLPPINQRTYFLNFGTEYW